MGHEKSEDNGRGRNKQNIYWCEDIKKNNIHTSTHEQKIYSDNKMLRLYF